MSLMLSLAGLSVLTLLAHASEPISGGGALSAEDAARAALRSPGAVAAAADLSRAQIAARSAARPADPVLSSDLSIPAGRWSAELLQPVLFPGEGRASRGAARAGLDAATLELSAILLRIAADARLRWAGAVVAEVSLSLGTQALEQASLRRHRAEARLETGDAAPFEIRLARLTEAGIAARVASLYNGVADARAVLAELVPGAEDALLPDDPLAAIPAAEGAGSRSDVLAASARLEQSEALRRAPGLLSPMGIGVLVEQEGGQWSAGPVLTLALPLRGSAPMATGVAAADVQVAAAELGAVEARARAEQRLSTRAATGMTDLLARVHPDLPGEAAAALRAIDEAEAQGELDAALAALLRGEVLDAALEAMQLRLEVTHARIQELLAYADPSLIPPDLRPAGMGPVGAGVSP